MESILPEPPGELESERLLLRPYRVNDSGTYYRAVQENWEHLYEFLPEILETAKSESEVADVIRWQNAEWQKRTLFIYGIWEKASGVYLGEAYLANPDWHVPSIELGYFLVRAATGKGFATEAARAVLHCAFTHLHVMRVDLQCRVDNLASQRVAERCGFQSEGCQRDRHRKKDGTLVDRLWYGLLRSEWQVSGL